MRLCCGARWSRSIPSGRSMKRSSPSEAASIVAALDGLPATRGAASRASPSSLGRCRSCWRTAAGSSPSGSSRTSQPGGYQALHHVLREMTPGAGRRRDHPQRPARPRRRRLSDRAQVGARSPSSPAAGSSSSATPTRAIPARSWIAACWRAIRTASWKGWPSPATRSGASQGYIYVRGEYPLAIQRLRDGHQAGQKRGLLGSQHLRIAVRLPHRHPHRRRRLRLRRGDRADRTRSRASAACRGRGRPIPPRRACGAVPTLINNVETFANIPPIIRRGGDWFASIGTEKSKGTKVFALAGKIRNTGLVEVPMGTTLRADRRGDRRRPAGRARSRPCRPAGRRAAASRPSTSTRRSITSRSSRLGSIMGSGGMIVMDQTTNMVDVARFFMEFCMDESCGKCIPCRAGTVQMHRLLAADQRGARATRARHANSSKRCATWSSTPASAAWARRRPTPC